MAKFSYADYASKSKETHQSTANRERNVGYFSLKDDGDEALVRFNYSSVDDFDIVTVHNVQVNGNWRRVSCLSDGHDSAHKCPLCESGERVYSKFYVKLIEYTKDENGNVKAQAKVWERPVAFADTIKSYLDEYGDLRNQVFKIKRKGAKGDIQTTYGLIFANPQIYKEELGYTKDFSAFESLDLGHFSYLKKSAEEMKEFLNTGKFPDKKSQNQDYQSNNQQPSTYQNNTYQQPARQTSLSQNDNVNPATNRIRRTYNY